MVMLCEWVVGVAWFCAVLFAILKIREQNAARAGMRLRRYLVQADEEQTAVAGEEALPFVDRVWRPFLRKLGSIVQQITPKQLEQKVAAQLQQAGKPLGMSSKEFVGWSSLLFGLGLFGSTLVAAQMANRSLAVLFWLLVNSMTLLLPRTMLGRRQRMRQKRIRQALPDTLDLLTVSVEAGLGFDQALAKVVEKTTGPLADEYRLTLQEIQMGKARRDALKDLGTRTGLEAMQKFTGALVQADKLGVGIGNVLRIQSEDMRARRRQEAEEKAMKAPIKMLFPLIFFIFPSLFVIILGPAVLQLMKMFLSF